MILTVIISAFVSCDFIVFENPFVHSSEGTPGVLGDWKLYASSPPVFPRLDFGTTVLDGKIWIVSGTDDTGAVYDDIWSSSDGTEWTQVHTAPFLANANPGFAAFGGQLFYYDSSTGEMYYSSDGVAWTNAGAQPMGAEDLSLVVTEGATMWAVVWPTGEVWSTNDATDPGAWSLEDDGSAFSEPESGQYTMTVSDHDDSLWMLGRHFRKWGEIWRFRRNAGWEKIDEDHGAYHRGGARLVSFEEYLWLLGGGDDAANYDYSNDVFRIDPETGKATRVRPDPPWDARGQFGSVVFENRIFVFGGVYGESLNPRTDVWGVPYEHFWD